MKRIAAITTVRNDPVFLLKWLSYYSRELGAKNLFVMLDGQAQKPPMGHSDVNFLRLPHVEHPRLKGDKIRAQVKSDLAAALFAHYDVVIGTDIDEFIALDPAHKGSLAQYLSQQDGHASLSPLGLDVVQHRTRESTADFGQPLLGQRRYAVLSDRYTKPAIIYKKLRWGAGLHRVKGHGYHIDSQLVLFHFGMVDIGQSTVRTEDKSLLKAGWKGHMNRRKAMFDTVAEATPLEGDPAMEKARITLQKKRRLTAWNKPKALKPAQVILIPERFSAIV